MDNKEYQIVSGVNGFDNKQGQLLNLREILTLDQQPTLSIMKPDVVQTVPCGMISTPLVPNALAIQTAEAVGDGVSFLTNQGSRNTIISKFFIEQGNTDAVTKFTCPAGFNVFLTGMRIATVSDNVNDLSYCDLGFFQYVGDGTGDEVPVILFKKLPLTAHNYCGDIIFPEPIMLEPESIIYGDADGTPALGVFHCDIELYGYFLKK